MLLDDEKILLGIARNDRTIVAGVYKSNLKMVQSWVQTHGGSVVDGEDVFQEAMTILFQKSQDESFRLTCKVGTYLVAVSKFIWYKRVDKQQKRPDFVSDKELNWENEVEERVYEEDVTLHEEREERFGKLNDNIEALGEPCRSLLRAFYYQEKSMQEIAEMFGYTNPSNAKTQKYKCLTRLKKMFQPA